MFLDLVPEFLVDLSKSMRHMELLDSEPGPHEIVLKADDLCSHEGSTVGIDDRCATQAGWHGEG